MQVTIRLFGALRDTQPEPAVYLQVDDGASIAQLREALATHAAMHWNDKQAALLRSCAFAGETTILRDADAVPPDGAVAILPPVNGG